MKGFYVRVLCVIFNALFVCLSVAAIRTVHADPDWTERERMRQGNAQDLLILGNFSINISIKYKNELWNVIWIHTGKEKNAANNFQSWNYYFVNKKILEDKSLIHTYFVKLHCKKKNQECFCFTSGDMDMKIDVIECTCTCMFSKGWVFPTSLGLYLGPGTGGTMSDGVQRWCQHQGNRGTVFMF